jgi:CheY-like chemotaxis protein
MRQREILCIDDDEQSLEIRKILLETCDFRVTTATSAKEGLRFFRTHQVDAVVLDYEMPEMNGGQVAKKMKAMRRDVPVLILSALPWLPNDAPRECVDAFITKGGPTRALVSELEQLMEAAPASAKRASSMRLAGAMSGVMVEKMRDLLGKRKPASSAKPLTQAPARIH